MRSIEQYIIDSYSNAESFLEMLKRHKLLSFLESVFNQIANALETGKEEQVHTLATQSLVRFNSELAKLSQNEKRSLEYLLSDIFQPYIKAIAEQGELSKLQETLLSVCQNFDYDYDELVKVLGLERIAFLAPKNIEKNTGKLPYYEWLGQQYELDYVLDALKGKGLIKSTRDMKRLFAPIEKAVSYEGNAERLEELLVVFDRLKYYQLIKPRVLSGVFTPLERYGVGNGGGKLFKVAPSRLNERLKRDEVLYAKKQAVYDRLLKSNIKSING